MIQPVRGRGRQIGYFLRGTVAFARERTVDAIARFVTGIIFAAYDRNVASIREAVADAPTAAAMRQFVGSEALTPKLAKILDWKTGQHIRKALRRAKNRRASVILAIDSTFKSTLSHLARDLFFIGRWEGAMRKANHIFVCGVLVFPDGRRLPLRPRQKRKGKGAPTQIDLAIELVQDAAGWLAGQRVVVAADGFFFSRKLLQAIRGSGFHYVIACQDNTVLADGTNLKSLLGKTRLRGSCVTLPSRRGERQKRFSAALRHLTFRSGERHAVVFSRAHRKRGARVKCLASDLLEATVAEIVRLYALRWQVEIYFREAKTYLGLDQYRVRGTHGPLNYLMLVTLAYQFVHWREAASARAAPTLSRIRELANEIVRENIAAVERAATTRHNRKAIREHFSPSTNHPKAHASRRSGNGTKRLKPAS